MEVAVLVVILLSLLLPWQATVCIFGAPIVLVLLYVGIQALRIAAAKASDTN